MSQLWRGAPSHDLPGYKPATDATTGLVPGPQAPTGGSCVPLLTGWAGGPRRVEAPLDRGEGNRLEPQGVVGLFLFSLSRVVRRVSGAD